MEDIKSLTRINRKFQITNIKNMGHMGGLKGYCLVKIGMSGVNKFTLYKMG